MVDLWSKNGGPSAPLPAWDRDATGRIWTSLADNAEGRVACGWEPSAVPTEVTMAQARLALLAAGLLGDVDAWVETQGPEMQIFWNASYRVRRTAPALLAAAAAKGWSAEQLDNLFIAAAAIP